MKTLITTLLSLISLISFGQRDVTGYYSSNVADLGFFVERIQLNKDLTFKFDFGGDLQYQRGQGIYRLEKNVIRLEFEPSVIDTTDLQQILHAADTSRLPKKLLYKNGKLWNYHVDGHVVRHGQAISRHKKYLFFGDRYITKRKMYLKKRRGKQLIWRGEENASR